MRVMVWNVKNNFDGGATQRDAAQAVIGRLSPDVCAITESRPATDSNWDTIGANLSMTVTKLGLAGSLTTHQFVFLTKTSTVTVGASGHLDDIGFQSGGVNAFQRLPGWMRLTHSSQEWIIGVVHHNSIANELYNVGSDGDYVRGIELQCTIQCMLAYRARRGHPPLIILGDHNQGPPPDETPQYPRSSDFTADPGGDRPPSYVDPGFYFPVEFATYPFGNYSSQGMTCIDPGRTGASSDHTTFDSAQSVNITEDVQIDFIAATDDVTVSASECYDSAGDADPATGISKPGTLPASSDSTTASDHYAIVADVSV